MGINIEIEDVMSLTEATKVLPKVNGKRPAISTLWRWCRRGLRGVHLEYVRVGRNIAKKPFDEVFKPAGHVNPS